ncbi:GNAT family N-acetyltransferase [Acinetobacter bohemicus]|nr:MULTISPECIES: GNAT family N-acetyltransferase [Acinetobacter]MCO8043336.1 GNAT family N-acetyltransferase [Acinetobacter sp. S4400-12]MCU7225618.1 GNAT family N-acetyltransferase [Acinetobacter bohemicus]
MNKIMIREGKVQDIPQIIQVIHDSIQSCVLDHQREDSVIQTWLEKFNQAYLIVEMLYNDCWVYILHDRVVGFLMVSDRGEILMHYVSADCQRMGFGTQLIQQMSVSLARKKIHQLEIQSTQTALAYYQKHGFLTRISPGAEDPYRLYKYTF